VFAAEAARILEYKQKMHDQVGSIVKRLASRMGGGGFEREFLKELASNLPLLTDAKILVGAMDDWRHLGPVEPTLLKAPAVA
jgi:hypothetical protein